MSLLVGWSHAGEEKPADLGPVMAAGVAIEDSEWGTPRGRLDVSRCRLKLMRARAKGNPDPRGAGRWAKTLGSQGWLAQLLNEPNLNVLGKPADVEGFVGGPIEHAAWLEQAIAEAGDGAKSIVVTPMSPAPGARLAEWLAPLRTLVARRCWGYAAHVYGDADQMWAALAPVLAEARATGKPVWITECAPRNDQDPTAWGRDHLPAFAWRVAREAPEVVALCVFAPDWQHFDGVATHPIRFRGTLVEMFLATWVAPEAEHPAPPAPIEQPAPKELAPMKKRAYIHQFDQLGEKSVAEIANTLRIADIREVACKTHQELTWLGRATNGDKSPLAFRSIDDVEKRFAEFKAEGIRMVPWCVPMGTKPGPESERAADVAKACDGVIELDTEPYREFWEGPYNLLLPYSDGIQEHGARYEVNFDAREGGWHPFTAAQFSTVCADADQVSTQTYWRWFQKQGDGRTTAQIVAAALAVLDVLEVPAAKRRVIFGYEAPDEFAAVTAQLQAAGVEQIGLWKMGEAGPAVYAALAAIPTTALVEEPAAEDPLGDALNGVWQRLDEAEAALQKARDEVIEIKRATGRQAA